MPTIVYGEPLEVGSTALYMKYGHGVGGVCICDDITAWNGVEGDNKSALVQAVAWRRTGDKPLPEPMMSQFTDAYMRH